MFVYSKNYFVETMTKARGFKKVWVEGNSINIINCLIEKQRPSWAIESFVRDSISMLKTIEEYFISHIYREGNWLTDFIANLQVLNPLKKKWESHDSIPLQANAIL